MGKDGMTPFYERDGIVIYCGECSQVMSQWDADSIDFWLTSPPYDNQRKYNGYTFDFASIAAQLYRTTKQGGAGVWVVADEAKDGSESGTSFRQALGFMGLGFNLHDTMIFYKAGNGAAGSHYTYWQEFEYMFILSKGQPKIVNLIRDRQNKKQAGQTNSRKRRGENTKPEKWTNPEFSKRGNVWFYSTGMNCGTKDNTGSHTAFFPEALARDHIISWSNPGDLVCDPMLGSGTTCKMAQQLGRRFVGCEISEDYCRIAVDRLRQPSFFSIPVAPQPETKPEQATMEL